MEVIAVQVVKLLEVTLLTVEQLHDVHSADILCYICIDTRKTHANGTEVIAHSDTEIGGDPEEWRHHNERHQCQLPIDDQQQDSYAKDSEHISKNGDGTGSEHLIQRVYVICEASHQSPYRIVIEV